MNIRYIDNSLSYDQMQDCWFAEPQYIDILIQIHMFTFCVYSKVSGWKVYYIANIPREGLLYDTGNRNEYYGMIAYIF
jgi:hypothetical protein